MKLLFVEGDRASIVPVLAPITKEPGMWSEHPEMHGGRTRLSGSLPDRPHAVVRKGDHRESISSPFRESPAWAYLQRTVRPGLPDRDTTSWAKEITASGVPSNKGTQ